MKKVVLAECISQVLTDKDSPIFLQGEPKAKGILEIEQDSNFFMRFFLHWCFIHCSLLCILLVKHCLHK